MFRRGSGSSALGRALWSAAVIAGVSTFAYAAIQGDYGLIALIQIEARELALAEELAALEAERARLENLTMRLSDRHLDLDLLDEQARARLGLIRPDEVMIR
ncbi:MAG: septum formation initiator family protein [Pseudomonadota bacterium]